MMQTPGGIVKFRKGDQVRIITPCRWFDTVGTVVDAADNWFRVYVDAPAWFHQGELVLSEHSGEACTQAEDAK